MPSRTEILLAARQHFRKARTVETLQRIEVPEWGDAELYYWPEMDLDEKRSVFRHLRLLGSDVEIPLGRMVEVSLTQVLVRSRDANGNRMFNDADENALSDTDPEVLQRISNAMGFGARVSLEDAEKN